MQLSAYQESVSVNSNSRHSQNSSHSSKSSRLAKQYLNIEDITVPPLKSISCFPESEVKKRCTMIPYMQNM